MNSDVLTLIRGLITGGEENDLAEIFASAGVIRKATQSSRDRCSLSLLNLTDVPFNTIKVVSDLFTVSVNIL